MPVIDLLMATFNEMLASTSRKYVAEQGILMLNSSKIFQIFRPHFSVFALEKLAKNLNFQSFLPLIVHLVATFNVTRAPTSRKCVTGEGILMTN